MYKNLEENIQNLRQSQGLTQVELGKRLNVSKQCISNWESGNVMPSVDMLVKIAKFFNVSTDYMLGLETKNIVVVDGLSQQEVAHINMFVQDLLTAKKYN